jgi:hypothetical protein
MKKIRFMPGVSFVVLTVWQSLLEGSGLHGDGESKMRLVFVLLLQSTIKRPAMSPIGAHISGASPLLAINIHLAVVGVAVLLIIVLRHAGEHTSDAIAAKVAEVHVTVEGHAVVVQHHFLIMVVAVMVLV